MAEQRALLQAVQEKHLDRLLAWPNVTAVDINYKTINQKETDQLCLVIWVRNKKPVNEIAEEEILPREIDGFPVDVVEGEAKLDEEFSWPTHPTTEKQDIASEDEVAEQAVYDRPLDTLRGGDSLAPINANYAGTLGYFVIKKNAVGILSNSHVMGNTGNKLISPAKKDGGNPTDYIGTAQTSTVTTDVDCAYAPLRGRITSFKLKDGTSVTGSEIAQVGTLIRYYGRTSGSVRQGAVRSINWSGFVGGRRFDNQIMISESILPGDSGSLLLNRNNDRAIGLNFAEIGGSGLANRIENVLNTLGVRIAV